MRVLLLTQYFVPEVGAPQIRLYEIVQQMRALGHEVTVVTALPNYPEGKILAAYRGRVLQREQIDGVDVIRTWIYPAKGQNLLKRLANALSFTLSSLGGLLWAPRPDFILVETPPIFLGLTAWLGAKLRRTVYVVNVADLSLDVAVSLGLMRRGLAWRILSWLERAVYGGARLVMAITEGVAQALHARKGVPEERLYLLPNGVNTERFAKAAPDEALRSHLGLDGKYILLYAGTHGLIHGLDVALEAADKLRAREDVHVVLVGGGSDKERLVALAKEMALANVTFLPPQPFTAMPRYYSIATAALVTVRPGAAYREVRSAKMLPALASEVPVIYAADDEGSRIVARAGAGIVTPAGDAAALAQAIEYIVDHPAEAAELGRRGRELAVREFSWQHIVSAWMSHMEKML